MNHYRQGDTLLRQIKTLPINAKEAVKDEAGRVVLAHGERTGHAHAFREAAVNGFVMETASKDISRADGCPHFIEIGGSGATLNHEHINGDGNMFHTIQDANTAHNDAIETYWSDLQHESNYNRYWIEAAVTDATTDGWSIGEDAAAMSQAEIEKIGDTVDDVIDYLSEEAAEGFAHNIAGCNPYEVIRTAAWIKWFELKSLKVAA